MNTRISGLFRIGPAVVATTVLLVASGSVFATEQSKQRQEGRGVKQDARQQAREDKIDCRQENNKSNAACRQDKRSDKQEGREKARDIKY